MVVLGLNNNQIQAMAEAATGWNQLDYFHTQLKHDETDKRTIIVRMYKFAEPGWVEFAIDENGTVFPYSTGGLD